MTILARNRLLCINIVISCIPAAAIVLTLFDSLAIYPLLMSQSVERSQGLVQLLIKNIIAPSAYVPLVSLSIASLYAIITVAIIYFSFEKTHSPEILFFALFVTSLAFEGLRIVLPLGVLHKIPQAYVVVISRVLLFGRLLGIFSLFTAGVYASGLEFQKYGNVIVIITAIALGIAMGIPMDGLAWDSSLAAIPGYKAMLLLADLGIAFITIISFSIAAYTKGSREFMEIAIGSVLILIGRDGLIHADTWLVLPLTLALLILGTVFITTRLHRYYLWI